MAHKEQKKKKIMSRQKISRALKRAICIEYMQSGKKGVKGVSVKGVKRNSATMRLRIILEVNIYM